MKASAETVTISAVLAIAMCGCTQPRTAQPALRQNPAIARSSSQAQTVQARPASHAASVAAEPTPAAQVISGVATPSSNPPASAPNTAPDAATAPKTVPLEKSQNLTIAQQEFRFLTHYQKLEATSDHPADQTVDCWELRDAKDKVLYREVYPVKFQNGTFDSTEDISASPFTTPRGSGFILSGLSLPSAPGSGTWLQIYGFKYGSGNYGADESLFVPFGPPISIDGEFLDVATDSFQPTPMFAGAKPAVVTNDVLRFKLSTGNFDIVYPVMINWTNGTLLPAHRCFEMTSKGQVERCSYTVMAEAHRDNQTTFVRLFSDTDDGVTPKHAVIEPQSKVEFLEAKALIGWNQDAHNITFGINGDAWLKIRIDGHEGWIHSEEDFEAVGLPAAD